MNFSKIFILNAHQIVQSSDFVLNIIIVNIQILDRKELTMKC